MKNGRWKRWGRKLALWVMVPYLLVLIIMWFLENRLVYFPATAAELWQEATDPRIVDVAIDDAIHGWWLPCAQAKGTLLICHGNAGNLSTRGPTMVRFAEQLQRNVLIFDYPGYGKSTGSPNEPRCYAAARAAYRWLVEVQHISPDTITLYGESLGGGVAVQLATELDHHSVVLMKTFTALPDVAAEMYPWLPVRWLMVNRFDSLSKISKCHRPILVVGATADQVVPFRHSEELFERANMPKSFFALAGSGHNDALPPDFIPVLGAFLDDPQRPRSGR